MPNDNKKDLPAKSDANAKTSDMRYKQQEEYDNRIQDDVDKPNEVRNAHDNEQMKDSQMGNERMKPTTKGNSMGQRGRDQHPE